VTRGLPMSTRGLVHVYHAEGHDVAALSGVDLHVAAGELVGLLGPSGSGKSTLLGLLGGLLRPTAGRVLVGDVELSKAAERDVDRLRSRTISLMLQGAARNLLPYLDVRENAAYAQVVARASGATDLPEVDDVLGAVGMRVRADAPLGSLTPGELQLAAVAAAVATEPAVLLADEPTSQLDHAARDAVLATIARINRELGTTVLIVTHDPEVASRLPRTVTIRDGRIGGEGRSGEEYAVVTADGFLPLPGHVLGDLPPGTLVRLHRADDVYRLVPVDRPPGQTR